MKVASDKLRAAIWTFLRANHSIGTGWHVNRLPKGSDLLDVLPSETSLYGVIGSMFAGPFDAIGKHGSETAIDFHIFGRKANTVDGAASSLVDLLEGNKMDLSASSQAHWGTLLDAVNNLEENEPETYVVHTVVSARLLTCSTA